MRVLERFLLADSEYLLVVLALGENLPIFARALFQQLNGLLFAEQLASVLFARCGQFSEFVLSCLRILHYQFLKPADFLFHLANGYILGRFDTSRVPFAFVVDRCLDLHRKRSDTFRSETLEEVLDSDNAAE